MKAHKLILAALAALFVMQACDEPEIDRAAITNVDVNNIVLVEQQVNAYCLSWAAPEITTNHGKAYSDSYDIYAAQKADTVFRKIKTVSGTWAIVTYDELTGLFKDSENSFDASDINSIVFGVCVTGLQTSMCYSDYDFYLDTDNELNYNYQGVNRWFVCGEESKEGRKQGNVAVVDVKIEDKNANEWAVQFCNVFHNLKKQAEGAKFTLRFEVLWDSETSDAANYAILTGTDPKVDGDKLLHDDYQWSEENTELLFEGGYWKGQNQTHIATKGEWTPVEWGGVIGEKGAEYIGVQLNLARPNEEYEVNNGTFYFRNITVEIDGDIVASYFMDRESGDAQVSAQADGNGAVVGGGYYAYGETALLTAVAQPGSVFAGWSDGSTENPRKLFVDGDVEFVAKFKEEVEVSKFGVFNGFNEWYINGAYATEGTIEDGVMAIDVKNIPDNADAWSVQFCNMFVGLPNQDVGQSFQLSFDVEWVGDADSASFNILAGKNYVTAGEYLYNEDYGDYQWVPYGADNATNTNTELIYGDHGFWGGEDSQSGQNKRFAAYKGKTTPIVWGGTIGEKGANGIGVEMNLARGDQVNNGTFLFSNIEVKIGGKVVKSWCVKE